MMFRNNLARLMAVLMLLAGLAAPAAAAQVDCDSVYCFSTEDFSGEDLEGICITELPKNMPGTLQLGERQLRPGDILTAEQVAQMTFCPERSEADRALEVGYLPVYADSVGPETVMTLSIRGKENKVPAAEDFAVETYKNMELTGKLKVTDPEGQPMTYAVTRQPRRGTVQLREDGSFVYTPKKNKVGVDSFLYTATDPEGKVSREATVTVTILKATDAPRYTDTAGKSCEFAAEWMKNTGIFVGERLDGNTCFRPESSVTRGEFVTMLVKTLEIPQAEEVDFTGYSDEIPQWLRPYVAAAVRAGLTAGLPESEEFEADRVITGAEAAVMLQNALDLPLDAEAEAGDYPVWAEQALAALELSGMPLSAEEPLNRGQAAELLYQASCLHRTGSRYITLE